MGDLHAVHLLLQYLASPTQTSRHIESRSLCRICPCVDYIVHAPFEVFFLSSLFLETPDTLPEPELPARAQTHSLLKLTVAL